MEEFESALAAAAKALPTLEARLAFASDYLRLRTQTPSGEALRGLISRHFAGADRQRLDALAGLMTPQNLADTFARISADNRKLDYVLVEGFQTLMFACQEDMDFNSPAGAAAMSARLRKDYLWPAEASRLAEGFIGSFYASCDLFPKHYRPGFHDPVTADIPTPGDRTASGACRGIRPRRIVSARPRPNPRFAGRPTGHADLGVQAKTPGTGPAPWTGAGPFPG